MREFVTSAISRERLTGSPALEGRFLQPADFEWGHFDTLNGARLRWGHLPVPGARAQCVLVGGEKNRDKRVLVQAPPRTRAEEVLRGWAQGRTSS